MSGHIRPVLHLFGDRGKLLDTSHRVALVEKGVCLQSLSRKLVNSPPSGCSLETRKVGCDWKCPSKEPGGGLLKLRKSHTASTLLESGPLP